jgi:hypothetical protein
MDKKEILAKLQKLRLGQTFKVKTDLERKSALNLAFAIGILITTRARKRGGFTVTRLPE